MDLALAQSPDSGLFDLVWNGTDLQTDDTLRPALTLSIFTNRRADASDIVPGDDPNNPGGADRGGYWGDWYSPVQLEAAAANNGILTPPADRLGSLLWLVGIIPGGDFERIAFAKRAIENSVGWMIKTGIATAMNVDVWLPGEGELAFTVEAVRPTGQQVYRFDYRWG